MITISLDEYGKFEENTSEPIFIAGVIYDDLENLREDNVERKRIAAYYRMVLQKAGNYCYPMDLHSNGNKERDSKVISVVKDSVANSLPEFLTKGTFEGAPIVDENGHKFGARKGKYHIFVMIKSEDGKRALLEENASILAKDNYSVNLYFHMASSVVNRIIFHNPIYSKQMPKVNIDVATRSTGEANSLDAKMVEQLRKQGFYTTKNDNREYYSIMNSDIYRTAISQEMVNSGKHKIKIENFRVSSIKYTSDAKNKEFLYLADSICSALSYRLANTGNADDWLKEVDTRVNRLNPDNDNMVFGYDEIDNDFAASWHAYEKHKFYDAIMIAYDSRQKETEFARFYSDRWFPYIESNIKNNISVDTFMEGIENLSKMLNINNLQKEKLLYVMTFFEELSDKVKEEFRVAEVKARTFFKMYEIGMSAFCHIGDSSNAIKYYEKCKEFSSYVGVDEFMRITNKLIVCFEDSFEWDKALELAKENIDNVEMISEIKKTILGVDDSVTFQDEAKAISQYARVLAEKRESLAEEKFKLALSKLEKNSANYKITQSYLLHYYADMNMKEEFEAEATDYFDGNTTYGKRFKYILKSDSSANAIFSVNYAIYVLIRGLYLFGENDISVEMWEKLKNIAALYKEATGKNVTGHPWNLIFKYLELIAIKKKDKEAGEYFKNSKIESCKESGNTIKAIDLYGMAQVAQNMEMYDERDKYTEELTMFLMENFDSLKDIPFYEDGDERIKMLDKYFTFMYR